MPIGAAQAAATMPALIRQLSQGTTVQSRAQLGALVFTWLTSQEVLKDGAVPQLAVGLVVYHRYSTPEHPAAYPWR